MCHGKFDELCRNLIDFYGVNAGFTFTCHDDDEEWPEDGEVEEWMNPWVDERFEHFTWVECPVCEDKIYFFDWLEEYDAGLPIDTCPICGHDYDD